MKMKILPGSLWIAYSVRKPQALQSMLPSHLQLANIPILKGDTMPYAPKLLFNAYDVESTWMHGHRVDIQTIAVDKKRNTVHLVIFDCLSNTLLWDPLKGVQWGNADCVRPWKKNKTDFSLRVSKGSERLKVLATRTNENTPIGWRFAVEANRECYFQGIDHPFPMSFDEQSIASPVKSLVIKNIENSFWKEFRYQKPSHIFLHEHEMIFDVHGVEI